MVSSGGGGGCISGTSSGAWVALLAMLGMVAIATRQRRKRDA